jgi:hypothetical protein
MLYEKYAIYYLPRPEEIIVVRVLLINPVFRAPSTTRKSFRRDSLEHLATLSLLTVVNASAER